MPLRCPTTFAGLPPPFPIYIPALLTLSPLTRPFNSYCAEYDKDPNNDAYDLETLRDFVQEVDFGMDGIEGSGCKPSLKSVKQVWKDFTAQFRRRHDPIPLKTTISVTNVRSPSIDPPVLFRSRKMLIGLKTRTTQRQKLRFPLYKRKRRYGTS
jgi:hypothetical protein